MLIRVYVRVHSIYGIIGFIIIRSSYEHFQRFPNMLLAASCDLVYLMCRCNRSCYSHLILKTQILRSKNVKSFPLTQKTLLGQHACIGVCAVVSAHSIYSIVHLAEQLTYKDQLFHGYQRNCHVAQMDECVVCVLQLRS